MKAAFAPGLEKVAVARLELYSLRDGGRIPDVDNLELLTSGKKISKLISLGRGLRESDALQLRIKASDQANTNGEADAWGGDQKLALAAEAAAAAAKKLARFGTKPQSGAHTGYWCDACKAHCSSATAWKQHYGSRHHQRHALEDPASNAVANNCGLPANKLDNANPWTRGMSALAQFPCRRGGTLDVSTKFFDLADSEKELLKLYLASSFNGTEELLKAFDFLLQDFAEHLRVKELFETIEIWKKVTSHLQRCNKARKARGLPKIERIYDVASGHGLLAVLLAYRFPHTEVVALDMERRAGFTQYVEAVNRFGACVGSNCACLDNLSFVIGKFEDFSEDPSDAGLAYVCVHGCNDLNFSVLRRAKEKLAAWLVVPCCIRDGLTDISVRCASADEQGDDSRHAIMCGIIASQSKASAIMSVDRRITNRHLIIEGDAAA